MKQFTFDIKMPYACCQDLYAQQIRFVVVQAHSGEKIRLPKENLKRFLVPTGINGRFELCINNQNKIVSLQKMPNL
jgi:hypothetical protein